MCTVLILNTWNYFGATSGRGGVTLRCFLFLYLSNSLSVPSTCPLCGWFDLFLSLFALDCSLFLVLYWLPRTHSETSESILTIPLRCISAGWFIHGSLSAWLLFFFFPSVLKWRLTLKLPPKDRSAIVSNQNQWVLYTYRCCCYIFRWIHFFPSI